MPSFISLMLALLRLAIRMTTRMQGLLIELHRELELLIEQQRDPLQIRSSDGQSTSLTTSPPTASTVTSDHVASSKSLAISTAEDKSSISMLESLRSQTFPSTREVPIISSSSKIPKRVRGQSTGSKNNSSKSSHPPLSEDEAKKIQEIELTLKLFNKEPIIEPVVTVLSKKAYDTHDSEDHSSAATSGIIRQSNEQSVVLQSISKSGTEAEDSHILEGNEFKWREYRMMLKWYHDEPVVSVPDGDGLDENESTELEPLDLSTNSENLGDTIDPEEAANKPHSDLLPNLLETTKETEGTSLLPLSESTPGKVTIEVSSAPTSSKKSTSSSSVTDREVLGSISKPTISQASPETAKSKDDSKHKRGKSKKERSRHSSEGTCRSKIRAPSGDLETDVVLEAKALPESLVTREPWLVTHKASYDLDLKFERNLHLKEYDISTIREKGASKITKSPIRDSLTKNRHDIESNNKTPSQVRHSPSDRKKSGRTPVKSNVSPSAVALPQTLSLPRFCVDSSTGNVQWKSDMPPSDFTSETIHRSPFKQSSKSPKKTNLEIRTISKSSIKNLNIPTKKTESDKNTEASESNSKSFPSETSTSEEEFQFKPTRERRPTPPPARFPEVETSTDSEIVDSKAKYLPFCTEPIKMSIVESEFKPTRERRPTPAARFPTSEFSANKDEKFCHPEHYEPSSILRRKESAAVEEKEFKSTRERKLTPAAKFVDHKTTSSDNESDKLAISVPVEALKLIGKSSPRRKNAVDDRPEQFSISRNQSIEIAEIAGYTFKPTRERRPTPAARFPTPESTDSEKAYKTPTQHAPQSSNTESFTKSESEQNPTCERMSFSVSGSTITRSPTRREDEVSVKSKLASRLVRKSSTSPRNSDKSRIEDRSSPTVKFQIPESQTKRENTGAIRKESKLKLLKTAKELSTSEEEYDSKQSLSMKRKASPAKYPFFKSPRMLEDAAAAARSINFSPHERPIEKDVETQLPCQGNTLADSVPILEKAEKNEDPHSDSSSGGSLLTVLLDRININEEGLLIHERANAERHPYEEDSTTFEGDSAPEGAACSGPRPSIRAPHNSPINFKVTDEPSTEMSQSESTTGSSSSDEKEEDSALEGDKCVSERPSAEDIRFLRQAGFRFESDSNSSTETSIGYGSGGDSAPEGAVRLFPQYLPESPNIAENVDTLRQNSTSESACRTASRDGSMRDSVPEGRVYIYSPPEPERIESVTNAGKTVVRVGTDFYLIPSNETSGSNMSEEDSSPEGNDGFSSQFAAAESPSFARNVDYISGSESTFKSTISGPSTSNNFVGDSSIETGASSCLLSENRSVTDTETVDINARFDSPTVIVSSHASDEDSAPEGTTELLSKPGATESLVNAERNKDELHSETPSALTASATETSIGDDFSSGIFAFEKTSPQKAANEFSSKTRAEKGTSLEADSTSSESLKYEGAGGDSDPEGTETSFLQTSSKEFPTEELPTNVEDSDDTSSETDSTSSESTVNEKSSDNGSGDDSAAGGAPNVFQEPETSKSPTNTGDESKDEVSTGAGFSSSALANSDTSTNKRFEGDTAFEKTANNCPRVETEKSPTDSKNTNLTGTDSTLSDFSQRTSNNEGATGGFVESTGHHNPQIETRNSSSANDTDVVLSEYGLAYVVELPSTDAESNSPERLSTIYEVSTNGTISDNNYSDAENGYSISTPSELSSEDEGEFVLEQDDHTEFCTTPTNGDISSESEASFCQESSRNEYLHAVESSEEICEWPRNEKETGKMSDSDTISSLSSPSKSADSEEESLSAHIKIENTSEPNSDKSETCKVTTLSLNTELKNIDEDRNVKVQSVCLQKKECLEVTDCEAAAVCLLVDTVERIAEGDILQETVSQTQILNTDFNSNSVDASCSLLNSEEKTSCDVPVESNNTDENKVPLVVKTQDFILEASASMEIENEVILEKESTTGLGDTLVSSKEIGNSMLAPSVTFALQVSAAESSNGVGDSQLEICSVQENIVTEEVNEIVQNESSEWEEACDDNNTITKELSTSQLFASDISILDCKMENTAQNNELTISIETVNNLIVQGATQMASKEHVSQSRSLLVSVTKEQSEMDNSKVLFPLLIPNVRHNEHNKSDTTYLEVSANESSICRDTNDDKLVKCSNDLILESFPKDVPSNVKRAEIYDCSKSQSVACQVQHIADITETDTSVASELLICEEIPLGSLTKLGDSPDVERATSPLTLNIQVSPSIEPVETKNCSKRLQWFVGKKLIKLNSAKHDIVEVSNQIFINEEAEERAKTNASTSLLPSETLVDKPHKNAEYSKATDSALEAATVPDTSRQVLSVAQKGTSNNTEHVNGASIETEYPEKFDCLEASLQPLVCHIPTCDEAELGSDSEISIGSDLLILENVPKGKFKLEIQNAGLQSTTSDLTCIALSETVGDFSEKPESITYKDSTDIHDAIDSSDSINNLKSESPIFNSTIARSKKTGNNLDLESNISGLPLHIGMSSGEDSTELEGSHLSQMVTCDMRSANVTEINTNGDLVLICNSSNDCAEHIKPDDATAFEVYIASEPVTGDIAFGSTIKVLDSSLPDTDYIEKIQDSTLSDTEFDSCEKLFTKHDSQNFKTNFPTQSVSFETPIAADIENESAIAKSHVAPVDSSKPITADVVTESSISESRVASMDSGEPTPSQELKTNVDIDVLVSNVSETLVCEASKNGHIESDNAVQESTSSTSTLEVSGSLDSIQGDDEMPEDGKEVEEDSGANVENGRKWKKKPRKQRKKRKH